MIRTGSRLVNNKKTPIFTSAKTGREYIKMIDIPTGKYLFVELDGALTFKTETSRSYPLPPAVEGILTEGFLSEDEAFEHKDEQTRRNLTFKLMREAMRHVALL